MAVLGIFDWDTVVIFVVVFVVYWSVAIVSTYIENEDYLMRVFAQWQLKLGRTRKKWGIRIASRLWTIIMYLDYKRRCRLAIDLKNAKRRLWIVRQFGKFRYNKRILKTCSLLESTDGIPKKIAEAARVAGEMMERCHDT